MALYSADEIPRLCGNIGMINNFYCFRLNELGRPVFTTVVHPNRMHHAFKKDLPEKSKEYETLILGNRELYHFV